MIHTGDCLEVMRGMEADSVDAVVTDPPAGIAFMSKHWDRDKGGRTEWVAWMTDVMSECYRVLKPGGYEVVKETARPRLPECPSCDDEWAAHVAGLHEEPDR